MLFKKNKGKSAASFCHYVAAWSLDIFYLVKLLKMYQPLRLEKKSKHTFGTHRIFGKKFLHAVFTLAKITLSKSVLKMQNISLLFFKTH
jgi:hypothetical protein